MNGPLPTAALTYDYDEPGRVVTRRLNGTANQATQTYDVLGRVITEANAPGRFTYGYDGASSRLTSVTYPNGQTSTYAYYGNTGDHRLQTIHHKYPGAATESRFDYT